MCTTNNSHRCSLTQLLVVWPLEGVCHAPHSNFSCILSALLPLFSFRDGRFAIFYFSLTYPSAPEILILSCDHGLYSEAVSYEEYFRQIFGLSGSKKVVENIPRKYYLGNMGSVLRFRNIFFCFWWRDVKAFRWGVTGGADDNITQQQIPTYAGAECCCAAVHTQPEEHNEYTEHTAVNSTAVYSSSWAAVQLRSSSKMVVEPLLMSSKQLPLPSMCSAAIICS